MMNEVDKFFLQKKLADQFSSTHGINTYFCRCCEDWTICCWECGKNYCGGGCSCCPEFMERMNKKFRKLFADNDLE